MTGEEFTARYRLTKQLAEGEIVSYSATNARRETLQVHVFRGDEAPEFDSDALDPEAAGLVREVLDVEGLQVVVTEVIEPFSDLASWMDANQRGSGEEPGAYTRIFGAIKLPEAGDGSGGADEPEEPAAPGMPSPPKPEPEPEPEPEPTTEVEPDGPGEYTRIFGAPRVPEPKPSEPANAPEPPPPPPPAPPEPPKAKPPAPPPPRAPDEPGPYTLVMGRPQVNPPSSEPRAPRAPEPPPRQESSTSPEDFLVSDTYLDRLREGGEAAGEGDTGASSGAPPPIPPPPPRASGPRVPSGPSEYTRIIRGGSLPGSAGGRGGSAPSAGPPPPVPTPSKPPARASRTPLIVGLVVTAAVLIALVLFLLLRP